MDGEGIKEVNNFRKPFCLQTLPWFFLNRFDRLRLEHNGENRKVYFNDGVASQVENGRRTIHHGSRLLVDGNDVFLPALWRLHREIIAYSADGYNDRTWTLPPDWRDVAKADIYQISKDGLSFLKIITVQQTIITLSLYADEMVAIVPAGTPKADLERPGISSRN